MLLIQGPVSLEVEEQASGKLVLLLLAGWPLAICFRNTGNPTFVEMTVRDLYATVILQYCLKFCLSEEQVHGRALFPTLYIVDARAWWLLVLLKLPFLGLMF